MIETLEVEAPVDKQMSKPLPFGEFVAARFALRFANIQKYLSLVLSERKGEHVGFVGLLAVLFVHLLGERITADDKRKFKTRTQDGVRDFFKRNIRGRAA